MKDKFTQIVENIKKQKAQRQQQKWNKLMVLDAQELLLKEEIVVSYMTPNLEMEERHLKEHNFYLAFHNSIWSGLEPHEKIAFLMKLDQKLVAEQNDEFAPKTAGKFVIGSYEDSYFAKRENGINTYYIGLEMLSDENVDSYTMLYMLFSLHMQAKAYEELEQKTIDNKAINDIEFNFQHFIKRPQSYDKFVMQEPMTKEEERETCEFLCQPIEQYAKLCTQKVEEYASLVGSIGLLEEDEVFELFLEDRAYFDEKEKELIENTYGKGVTPSEVYLSTVNKNELER